MCKTAYCESFTAWKLARPYIVRCGCSGALKDLSAELFEPVNLRAVQSYLILNFLVTLQQILYMYSIIKSCLDGIQLECFS